MAQVRTRIGPVPAESTYALRQRVLRPHQTPADMRLAGDEDAATVHLGAVDDEGRVVSTLRLQPAVCPWYPTHPHAWQLRGMATAEEVRGRGVGGELLTAAILHVASSGGGLLWCNARTPAEAFYARAGFSATEVRWDDPQLGPHVGMVREVAPE